MTGYNPIDYTSIWLEPRCADNGEYGEGRQWADQDVWGRCDECGCGATRYIRADFYESTANSAWEGIRLSALVEEWRNARQAVLAEPTPDVRTSADFRAALDRLASAEAALFNLKGVSP